MEYNPVAVVERNKALRSMLDEMVRKSFVAQKFAKIEHFKD